MYMYFKYVYIKVRQYFYGKQKGVKTEKKPLSLQLAVT